MRQVDSKRKIELEKVDKQLAMVKQDAEDQRYKLSAQRVRNSNLQNEIVGYKQQLATLSEKSNEDDLHICKLKVRSFILFSFSLVESFLRFHFRTKSKRKRTRKKKN